MIDLAALKEQLRQLGHDLPDDQVVAILKEMNIDFNDEAAQRSGESSTAAGAQGERGFDRPPRTGSILDNVCNTQPPQPQNPPSDAVQQGFNYGYTSPGKGQALGSQRPSVSAPKSLHSVDARSEYTDADGSADDEDPRLSCRYCEPEGELAHGDGYGYTSGHSRACAHGPGGRDACLKPAALSGAGYPPQRHAGDGELADQMRHMSLHRPPGSGQLQQPASGRAPQSATATGCPAPRPSLAAQKHLPRGAADGKDQTSKPIGGRGMFAHSGAFSTRILEDEESDVALADPDKDLLGLGASLQDLMQRQRKPAWQDPGVQRPGTSQAAGRASGSQALGAGPYAGWLGGPHQGALDSLDGEQLHMRRPLSPQASDRSFVSRTSTRCSIASKARAKKVDRVQRYQQLQQEWSQSRFLKQGGGTMRGSSRKPVNFHNHFASLHAAEEAERQRMLRETRARTKQQLGAATEAPTANRRDELRWQTRMRLREQT